jgi:predicted DNA-binding transcriptional regulator YafY
MSEDKVLEGIVDNITFIPHNVISEIRVIPKEGSVSGTQIYRYIVRVQDLGIPAIEIAKGDRVSFHYNGNFEDDKNVRYFKADRVVDVETNRFFGD